MKIDLGKGTTQKKDKVKEAYNNTKSRMVKNETKIFKI